MSDATTRSARNEADKAKQSGTQAAQHAGQAASDFASAAGQKAQDVAGSIKDKAQDLAGQAGQKAQDLAHAAGQKVQDYAHAAEQRAEDATSSVGGSLKSAADRLRQNTPHEGMFGRASEAVASTLEGSGSYLQDKNLPGMAEDVTNMIRRNPIPAVLLGLGLGFLLGRTLRS